MRSSPFCLRDSGGARNSMTAICVCAGDSAYPLEPWLMTPAPDHPALNTPEEHFNIAYTSTRSEVERCIGILKSRFRYLQRHRTLHYSPRKAGTILAACVALHNLCLERLEPFSLLSNTFNGAGASVRPRCLLLLSPYPRRYTTTTTMMMVSAHMTPQARRRRLQHCDPGGHYSCLEGQ